jgi:hypothetical protein
MRDIPGADWKVLRKLHPLALNRFCERALNDVCRTASASDQTPHERYLAVFELLRDRDEEIAEVFDDPRRSRGLLQLAGLRRHQLISDEEFARFSAVSRDAVEAILAAR